MSQMSHSVIRPAAAHRVGLSRRASVTAAAYSLTVTMLGTTLPTPLYALYRSRFGFSELIVTVVFATYAAGVIAALLLTGRLSDQIGRRQVLLAGLFFSAVSAAVFLLANGLDLLIAARLLSGLSAGIFTGTATATLVDLSAPEHRARATLVATAANMGGLGLGSLLAGGLAQFAPSPLHATFWVDLALLAPAFVLVWEMPDPVASAGRKVRLHVQRLRVPAEVRSVFVSAVLAAFGGFAVLGLFTAVVPGFVGQILGIHNPAVIGAVVSVAFAGSTVGQIVSPRAFGASSLAFGGAGLLVGMGLLAAGLGLSSLPLVVASGAVAGLGHGASFRAGLTALNEASPSTRRGEVASSFFAIAYIAISLPVVGVGVLTSHVGLRIAGLIFAGAVAALAAAVVVRETKGQ